MKNIFLKITLVVFSILSIQISDARTLSVSSIIKSTDAVPAYKKKGCKVFITTNDENAKTHFINELFKLDFWEVVNSKSESQFEVKLILEKINLVDREVYIKIIDNKTNKVVYTSDKANGTKDKIHTLNFKQAAVQALVQHHLKKDLFTSN
jgi:hypothetical protein